MSFWDPYLKTRILRTSLHLNYHYLSCISPQLQVASPKTSFTLIPPSNSVIYLRLSLRINFAFLEIFLKKFKLISWWLRDIALINSHIEANASYWCLPLSHSSARLMDTRLPVTRFWALFYHAHSICIFGIINLYTKTFILFII